jgi:hypothetical protein
MISKPWRQRLTYAAMSLFLAWHTLALVVAPVPDSEMKRSLRRLLGPYLTLFRLSNTWDFYAPNVGLGQQFRYLVEDGSGNRHTFIPTNDFGWFQPHYWWFRAWHNTIIDSPDDYGDLAAALFCKEHAALDPISITLVQVLQKDFVEKDQLAGRHPMDAEFVTENILKHVRCPGK